jgi:hypothetical protein
MQKYIFPSEYARLVTFFGTNITKKHTFFGANQQNFTRKSPKFKEKRYLCLHKRSVTSMRKYPISQCFETDGGHFANGLEKGGTRHICKTMKDNGLHLSPFPVNLSEVRLYRLR